MTILGTEVSKLSYYVNYLEFQELKKNPNSLVHYTRAFDKFLLDGVFPEALKGGQLPDEYSQIDNIWLQNLARKYNDIDYPWFSEVISMIVYFRDHMKEDIKQIKHFIFIVYCKLSRINLAAWDNFLIVISYYLVLIAQWIYDSNMSVLSFCCPAAFFEVSPFAETIYFCDIFLVIGEFFIIFLIFTYTKRFFKIKSISNKFYDDIVNFFKLNGLSFVEITSVITLFFFFIVGDIVLSFGEDCYFDNLFYGIIIFIVLCLFLLLVALDIRYFYSMNSVASNSVNVRTLVFDIFNNFISLLRIFLCWIRYIIYDIQVDLIDLNYFYLDYNNDIKYFLSSLSTDKHGRCVSASNILSLMYSYINIIAIYLLDVFFIIAQIVICVFKLFIAFYILWLILDLFFFKILNHKELKRRG